MSVREYRDARREVEQIEVTINEMKVELKAHIAELKKQVIEAESELEHHKKNMSTLAKNLTGVFVTKVDDEMIFRLSPTSSIQIIEITEE